MNTSTRLLFVPCVLMLLGSPLLADTNVSGTISADTTWNSAGSPYIVTGWIVIANQKTLTVEPGVVVKFNANVGMTINGKLSAVGTSTAGITFTSSAATPTRGAWFGLDFATGTNPPSQLSYVTIAYSGSSGYAVRMYNGRVDLVRVTITESSSVGIQSHTTSTPSLSFLTVSNCTSHGMVIYGLGVQTGLHSIANSTFTSNGGYGINLQADGRASVTDTAMTNNGNYAFGAQPGTDLQGLTGLTVTGNGGGSKNAIEYRSGTISARDETFWGGENISYVIPSGVTVGTGRVLTIAEGSTLKFGPSGSMTINGRLSSVGTITAGITFTSSAATPTRGAWPGITFATGTNPTSQLSYSTIAYSGSAGYAVRIQNGRVDLDRVTITESSTVGIDSRTTSTPSLSFVTVSNCTSHGMVIQGVGVQTGLHSIANSTFTVNGGYGLNFLQDGRASIADTVFTNNGNYALGAQPGTDIQGLTGLTVTGNGGGSKNAIEYRSGTISARDETFWGGESIPYVIPSGVTVGTGRVLTIAEGSTLKFGSSGSMTINGKLSAVGTSTAGITFTSSAATPTRGAWLGLTFATGTNPTSQLSYVTIAYSGSSGHAVRIQNGRVDLVRVTITESSTVGILSQTTSAPSLSFVTVSNCTSHGMVIQGVGVQTGLHSIANSTFTSNGGYGINLQADGRASVTDTAMTNNGNYAFGAQPGTDLQGLTGLTVTGNGGGSKNAIEYRSGTISTRDETFWGGENISYVIPWGVGVATGRVLTIVEGSTIKFGSIGYMTINGRLSAVGTSTAGITFTSSAATPTRGSWQGIDIQAGSNPSSEFAYTTISYGGGGGYALRILNGSVTLDRVTVTESAGVGIQAMSPSPPSLNSLTVSNCTSHGLMIQDSWPPAGPHTITDSAFTGNGGYGLRSTAASAVVVRRSSFGGNALGGATASASADMRLCHWNAASGPGGSGFGTGQSVNASINFEPWLTSAPVGPHQVTDALIKNKTFNPSINTSWKGTFATSTSGAWTATIRNAASAVVRTYSGSGISTGEIAWDGKDTSGVTQPNGIYSFDIESVLSPDTAAPARGRIVIDTTKVLSVTALSASPSLFSPNGDGVNDTTTFSATANYDDAEWTLLVKDSASAAVRTFSGNGPNISIPWDGKNESGLMADDGSYSGDITVSVGAAAAMSTRNVSIDTLPPTVALTAPGPNEPVSNVYMAGSYSSPVVGTVADATLQNWTLDYSPVGTPGVWTTVVTGTAVITEGQIAVWNTQHLQNGTYTMRLRAWDLAGTQSTAMMTSIVGHFRVSQDVYELSVATADTITYTSTVPFPLTQTLAIRNSAGATVRTLVSGQRNEGSYADEWDGRDDNGLPLPDGPYSYVATATDGSQGVTWDLSNKLRTEWWQHMYPSQSTSFDPFNNQPLAITYSFPRTGRVYVIFTDKSHAQPCGPNDYCWKREEFQAAGTYTLYWAGVDDSGALRPDLNLVNVSSFVTNFPENVVVLFGTKPVISPVTVTPPYYAPFTGPQTVSFSFSTYQSGLANAYVTFRNQESGSVLRTIYQPNLAPGAVTLSWDGRADNGTWVAPGVYIVTATVTDAIGNSVNQQILTQIAY